MFEYGSNINGSWEKNLITGAIKQWGKIGATTAMSSVTITFPISFSSKVENIQITKIVTSSTAGNSYIEAIRVKNYSLTNTVIWKNDNGGAFWEAIGY